ncbi:MAG: lipase [Bacteroidaceae bacterium]|nr:lipase [Bacteroidaceae bacterium]
MKKLSLSLMALLFGTASATAQPYDWANFARYEAANATVRTLPQERRKVVFIGNSITDNWANRHPDFFNGNGYVGRGISGQTTYQMVLRFQEDVVNLHPLAVVINAGINDVAQNNHVYVEDRTFHNIDLMAQMAAGAGIKVVIASITPCAQFSWRKEIPNVVEKIKSLNARLKAYAEQNGYPYVDYFTAMADEDGAMNNAYSEEGCHPNATGYSVMSTVVQPVLRKVLLIEH